ncbi:hypothetical protein KKG22_05295 [Patescibacteria group bacterium]|nr:hypothetical protein [Patescibacteria group bacterium]MBU1721563.1 hypothetical protein [Patescibacteria group bacterium]MBU1901459.1 hypothetical protein [Patescibacteria group bacterium]
MKIYCIGQYQFIPRQIMRKCAYGEIFDHKTRQISYVRRMGNGFYPRFHVYIDTTDNGFVVNLHLDQKKASYTGSHAHNAEYDGPRVEQEAKRIEMTIAQYKIG